MLEIAIVTAIVLAASILAGRSLYKALGRKDAGCGCAGPCPGCTTTRARVCVRNVVESFADTGGTDVARPGAR
ncbi:MAG: FeoB-associated Cys-rich membrane protein [Planctomycetota bacterium]|nr:MAG: FeoB-associated Cys-rich membrane protein [Planctomycetota bacterium]